MGHPNFLYLSKLFPHLYSNKTSNFIVMFVNLLNTIEFPSNELTINPHDLSLSFIVTYGDHLVFPTEPTPNGSLHLSMITLDFVGCIYSDKCDLPSVFIEFYTMVNN